MQRVGIACYDGYRCKKDDQQVDDGCKHRIVFSEIRLFFYISIDRIGNCEGRCIQPGTT